MAEIDVCYGSYGSGPRFNDTVEIKFDKASAHLKKFFTQKADHTFLHNPTSEPIYVIRSREAFEDMCPRPAPRARMEAYRVPRTEYFRAFIIVNGTVAQAKPISHIQGREFQDIWWINESDVSGDGSEFEFQMPKGLFISSGSLSSNLTEFKTAEIKPIGESHLKKGRPKDLTPPDPIEHNIMLLYKGETHRVKALVKYSLNKNYDPSKRPMGCPPSEE